MQKMIRNKNNKRKRSTKAQAFIRQANRAEIFSKYVYIANCSRMVQRNLRLV